MLYIEAYLLQ